MMVMVKSRAGPVREPYDVDILNAEILDSIVHPGFCILAWYHILTTRADTWIPAQTGFLVEQRVLCMVNMRNSSRDVNYRIGHARLG